MNRRNFITLTTAATTAAIIPVIGEAKAAYTARQCAMQLLTMANRVSDSNLANKDEIAELIEAISAKVMRENKVGALCGTDTECAQLDRKLR